MVNYPFTCVVLKGNQQEHLCAISGSTKNDTPKSCQLQDGLDGHKWRLRERCLNQTDVFAGPRAGFGITWSFESTGEPVDFRWGVDLISFIYFLRPTRE